MNNRLHQNCSGGGILQIKHMAPLETTGDVRLHPSLSFSVTFPPSWLLRTHPLSLLTCVALHSKRVYRFSQAMLRLQAFLKTKSAFCKA